MENKILILRDDKSSKVIDKKNCKQKQNKKLANIIIVSHKVKLNSLFVDQKIL